MPALTLMMSFIIIVSIVGHCNGQLQVGFYKGKCQSADVENVVFQVVKSSFNKDPTITAALLRMHFHDCFVNVREYIYMYISIVNVYLLFCKCMNIVGLRCIDSGRRKQRRENGILQCRC